MRIDLISTGEEILRGEAQDTNAAFAASALEDHGFEILRHHTCGDGLSDLVDTLRLALDEADAVVMSGGLGPTQDDRTVDALACVLGVSCTTDPTVLETIRMRLDLVRVPLTANQERQARIPNGASPIANPMGTAPGIETRHGEKLLFCLPGPPAEFEPMLLGEVLPRLQQDRLVRGDLAIRKTKVLRTFGRGEGWIEDALGNLEAEVPGLTVGFRATLPEIQVKLRACCANETDADAMLGRAEQLAGQRLGDVIFSSDGNSLPAVVLKLLTMRRQTLALAESCTGGLVAKLLTDIPGSSAAFVLSTVTYADSMKEHVLQVPKTLLEQAGSVSEACAKSMAEGVRRLSCADLAVAITGIAGPDGGTADKPVGTVFFAVSDSSKIEIVRRQFSRRQREVVRALSAFTALDLVRRRLLALPPLTQPKGARNR